MHFYLPRLVLAALLLCGAQGAATARNSATPTGFIENKGQLHNGHGSPTLEALYLLPLPGMNVQLRVDGFSYDTYTRTGGERLPRDPKKPFARRHTPVQYAFHRLDVAFVNAASVMAVYREGPSADVLNYYSATAPNGATGVHHFGKVTYKDVWPGIDVEFLAQPGADKPVEYNFILHPGANVSDIQLRYTGATAASLKNGKLHLTVAGGTLTESIPASFWAEGGEPVEMAYKVLSQEEGAITVGFTGVEGRVGEKLIIDPNPNISWGTYYGGSGYDLTNAVSTDPSGNSYITGTTASTTAIATAGAHQSTSLGSDIAFLAKFNSAGVRQWGTYYGTDYEEGFGAAADPAGGAVYMVGLTTSTSGIASAGAHQTAYGSGDGDGMLVKFDDAGVRQWATYYGGSDIDAATSVTVDGSGNPHIVGATSSTTAIASTGAHQTSYGGGSGFGDPGDGFVVKFNSSGVRQWGTYYGGSDDDYLFGLGVSNGGDVYASGFVLSTGLSTPGSHQSTLGGGSDALLVKFNSSGTRQWATYYGGTDEEQAFDLAVDASGAIHLCGSTSSTSGISTPGAHQPSLGGSSGDGDVFVAKFNDAGVRQWGTYYGGSNYDFGGSVAVDASDAVYIGGSAFSTTGISTPGSYQPSNASAGSGNDGFLAKLSSTGTRIWGTYYGGSDDDYPSFHSVAVSGNAIFLTGETYSSSGIATTGAHQTTIGSPGGSIGDAFLARFTSCTTATPTPTVTISAAPGLSVCAEVPVTFTASSAPAGVTYQWLRNGTPVSGATSASYTTAALADNDAISCIATFSDTCGSASDTSNVLTMDIKPLPVPVITRTGSTFSTGTFSSYQWLRNGTPISGATSKNYTSSVSGVYRVIVTGTNGCADTSAPYNFSMAVGDAPDVASQTSVFPNPTAFEVFFKSPVAVDAVLSTLDGRTVLREEDAKSLDLRALPDGLYLLRLYNHRDGALIKTEKVSKRP